MPQRTSNIDIQARPDFRSRRTVTLVEAVVDEIQRVLKEKNPGAGELIPPERSLAETFEVSRVTVRNALSSLVNRGILEREPGVGYRFVGAGDPDQGNTAVGIIYYRFNWMANSISVAALESRFAQDQRGVMLGASGGECKKEDQCIIRMRSAGVRSLIVQPAVSGRKSKELERWIKDGFSTILMGHPGRWKLNKETVNRCPMFDVDNIAGITKIMEYLYGLGHRSFAYVTDGKMAGSERHDTFRKFVYQHHCMSEADWQLERYRYGDSRFEEIFQNKGRVPTAVVCAIDDTALGVMEQLSSMGLECPRDVSVTGFGNESQYGPGELKNITTVDYSREEEADQVARIFNEWTNDKTHPQGLIRTPLNLIVRSSCSAVTPSS